MSLPWELDDVSWRGLGVDPTLSKASKNYSQSKGALDLNQASCHAGVTEMAASVWTRPGHEAGACGELRNGYPEPALEGFTLREHTLVWPKTFRL